MYIPSCLGEGCAFKTKCFSIWTNEGWHITYLLFAISHESEFMKNFQTLLMCADVSSPESLLRGPNHNNLDWLAANKSTSFARIPDHKKK